ncbi:MULTISPECIES: type IV secretory system conjugative DNA transfer family protein [Campylobacter]|uniref:type IV secretory system conjugative DNA transfer family protein n=1 Tax=Campylobacter TaxID=194 RepID=UPI0023F5259D|nr:MULTISPECIES: type IV secretory system conjugative DNA transfer family protein [Campylobacter]MCI6641484.1 type IV secretory system conjugative DNA transfer family protein [Campylobacter sp.]MDD7422164.1 type IV secretory system conjugative DNA transfer family protein [Campylobacter hominis]MDY3117825.1 type IV secretory system conjugative DNA transfer family protein [Campylobacter hominis]
MDSKFGTKKWIIIFLTSIIMGVVAYLAMVKLIFNPDIINTPKVALQIIYSIGEPALKFKAYVALLMLVAPFIMCIIWWLMPYLKDNEDYGSARFATPSDFEKMKINYKQGLVLGCLGLETDNPKFLRATQPLSTLVVAPPGSGKTAGMIIPNLLSVSNSSVTLDIKGELYQKTAGYRQKNFNNEIQLFSPFSWNNTLFFNPFDNSLIKDMQYLHIKKLAEQVASTIFVGEAGKENDHWIVSAKTMFVFFAEYFMQKNRHATLAQLAQAPKADYFDYLENEFIEEALEDIDEDNPEQDISKRKRDYDVDTFKIWLKQTSFDESIDENTRNQARAYSKAAENEFASIKSTYDTFMKVFTNPQVANATSKMSFSFEDLREKRISMYVVVQTEDMEILAPLIRIFIETLFKKLMSGHECSDPNKFIYCFLDEFVRFGKMPFLLEAPALCRSYGLLPVFVTQSYEQIKKYYGEDDMNIVKNNSGYQVIFNMNSDKDAEDTSRLIGDYTNIKISKSQGNMDFLKSNISKSKEAKRLVTAQDLKNQDSSDILILVKGFFKLPIKAKVPYWFKMKEWKGADKIEVTTKNQPQNEQESKNEIEKREEIAQESKETKDEAIITQKQEQIDEKKLQRDELLKFLKIKVEKD